jgi:hypothetical protein
MKTRTLAGISMWALCAAGAAEAAPFRILVDTCSEVCSHLEDTVPIQTQVVGSNTTGYLYGQTHWNVRAAAEPGTLRAYAHAESVPNALIPSNVVAPSVAGNAIANVRDNISFVLPGPGLVPVTFEVTVTGGCSGTDGTNSDGTFRSSCTGGAGLFLEGQELVGAGGGESNSVTRNFDFLPTDPTGPFEIEYILSVQGQATNGMFTGDFFGTANVRITTTAPGVSIVSESGYDYAVPLPSAAWLIAPAFTLLGPWVRRRRR